jgi:hypothetical protein
MKILFLMMLFHIIDDFVFQPICLSKLKQNDVWKNSPPMYKNDYIMALFIHALSWSIMIHLPLFIFCIPWWVLILTISSNLVVHMIVDDLKANLKTINLVQDQSIHLIQIILTFVIYYCLVV